MLLLAGAPAFAQTGSGQHAQMRQQIMDNELSQLASKLGLDQAGTARFRQTFTKYQAQLGPLHREQWQTRRALKDELATPQPNAARLTQLTDELSSNRQQMQAIEAQRSAELKQQLTPQQYAQLVVSRREIKHDIRKQMHALRGSGDASKQ
jgi:Spy/CpxP family protein refolding chaperone